MKPGFGWIILSVVFDALFLVTLWFAWKRLGRYPPIRYGGVELTQRSIRRLWLTALILAFGVAAVGIGSTPQSLTSSWEEQADPVYLSVGGQSGDYFFQLPFYRYEISEDKDSTGTYLGSRTESLRIPWLLFAACLVYFSLVPLWPGKRGGEARGEES